MHPDLEFRRHVLVKIYRRYLAADRAWLVASREVQTWFPKQSRRVATAIGNPGSHIRDLYERRDQALRQLAAARHKLQEARQRIEQRRLGTGPQKVMLISFLSR